MPLSETAKFSVAPMLDLTDRHFRYLCRKLTAKTLLYTEMIPEGAVLYGRGDPLFYNPEEHPVALQLGGADPARLAACAKLGAARGYDEINLNAGCPSERVRHASFGAALMRNPGLVCDIVKAMKDAAPGVPVTVKTRLGVDELDGPDYIRAFVAALRRAGAGGVIIHARKAVLTGMSPKDNRGKPPLDYRRVYDLKKDFPDFPITLNGGVRTLEEAAGHLGFVDGVMAGREPYRNPYMLADADRVIFGAGRAGKKPTRKEIIRSCYPYIEAHLRAGGALKHVSRHFFGMFLGCPNGRLFRQYLSLNQHLPGAGPETLERALSLVPDGEDAETGPERP